MAAVLGERDKGGNFFEMREINDPMEEGEARKSWSVRNSFDDADYKKVIIGSSKNNIPNESETAAG